MRLTTAFTTALSIDHPVVLASMGDVADGTLAAAVSNGGGLGLVGGGVGDQHWLAREVATVAECADRPWGVGFLCWYLTSETLEWTLARNPAAILLSFGDPRPFARAVLGARAKLIVQVTDLDEARQAWEVGAHVIVAQGSEARGHVGHRGTLPFVPAVVDLAAPPQFSLLAASLTDAV